MLSFTTGEINHHRIRSLASIGAGCYIGPGVVIGSHTKLYPNVTVLDDSHIGDGTVIWSRPPTTALSAAPV